MNQPERKQLDLSDYLQIFRRQRGILIVTFLAVFMSAAIFSFTTVPLYESKTTLMIEEESGVKKEVFEVTSFIKRETKIKNQVEILESRTLAEAVIRAVLASPFRERWIWKESNEGKEGMKMSSMVERLHNSMEIIPIRDTDIIEVRVTAPDPELAAFLANTLADQYHKKSLRSSRGEITEVREFLEGQLANIQEELRESEEKLKGYKQEKGIAALSEETEELVRQLATFEALYNEAKTDLNAQEKRLSYMREQLAERKSHLVDDIARISSPLIQELRKKMAELEGIRANYIAQGFSKEHPKMQEIMNRTEDIKRKLISESTELASTELSSSDPLSYSQDLVEKILSIEIETQSLSAKTNALRRVVDTYSRQLNSLPEKSLELARLERNAKVGENIYLMLKEKYEEAKIKEAGQIGNVRIIDIGLPPEKPIRPKKKLNLALGGALGLLLGIGLGLLRQRLDVSIRTIEDMENLGLPSLGSIPVISEDGDRKKRESQKSNSQITEVKRIASNLVTHFEPKSPISEAYRAIRTNIQFTRSGNPPKTVLVTSSGPKEGKSTTVANLGITLAQMGIQTLLVDCDLRKPVLHSIFELEKEKGLTHYLVGKAERDEIVKPTLVENLSLITCGILPPNPSELLGSKRMSRLVQELKNEFEMILFDSPPVIAVTDATVLSTILDGVILVISSGEISEDAVLRTTSLLNNVSAKLLGGVLNKVNLESSYGSYHYYYHYYYGDRKKKIKRRRKDEEKEEVTAPPDIVGAKQS
ncbi:MAG: GumC family protein [Candidatus Zixiibacteriota bacterium]